MKLLATAIIVLIMTLLSWAYGQQAEQAEVSPSVEQKSEAEEGGANGTDGQPREEADSPAAPVVKGSKTESQKTESQKDNAQPAINPDSTFTPTEEISEDKPVAFPVDI